MRLALLLLLVPTFDGCASLGERVARTAFVGVAPDIGEILSDLSANDARIRNFRAAGTFTLESPEFKAVKKFRGGRIFFRRPSDLYVQGNHRITNITLFKLISVGKEFLIEFPHGEEQNYYELEGVEFEDVPFSVSPSDVAREMFLSESWGDLGRREVRIVGYDEIQNIVTIEVGPKSNPRRTVVAARVNLANPSWVVVENRRYNDDGTVLALTRLGDYRVLDGALFPAEVDGYFPTEATRMKFEMRNIRINTELPEGTFDIRTRARELGLDVDDVSSHPTEQKRRQSRQKNRRR